MVLPFIFLFIRTFGNFILVISALGCFILISYGIYYFGSTTFYIMFCYGILRDLFIPLSQALISIQTPKEVVGKTLRTLHTGSITGTLMGPLLKGVLKTILDIVLYLL